MNDAAIVTNESPKTIKEEITDSFSSAVDTFSNLITDLVNNIELMNKSSLSVAIRFNYGLKALELIKSIDSFQCKLIHDHENLQSSDILNKDGNAIQIDGSLLAGLIV